MTPEPLHKIIPARAEEIAPLRSAVREYAEHVGITDSFGVALALSETVANAVLHAYVDEPSPGEIMVTAEPQPIRGLRVTVVDHGRGMVPRPNSPGAGLGLPLVAHFADRFEITDFPQGGTQISMLFGAG